MSMTKLNQNTTDLQALAASTGYQEVLDLVNALPDAGGSGGGGASVETCTVTVNSFASNIRFVRYSSYEDGAYKWNDITYNPLPNQKTLSNVVVGSLVEVSINYSFCGWNEPSGSHAYYEPSANGVKIAPTSDVTLVCFDDD